MVGIFDPWVRWVPWVCEMVDELLLLEREKSGIVNGRRRYRDSKVERSRGSGATNNE